MLRNISIGFFTPNAMVPKKYHLHGPKNEVFGTSKFKTPRNPPLNSDFDFFRSLMTSTHKIMREYKFS